MPTLTDKNVLVAGGTANVGAYLVDALLAAGARVAVPTRSEQRAEALHRHLRDRGSDTTRLHVLLGDFGDDGDADRLRAEVTDRLGRPEGVAAALGQFVTTERILQAPEADLRAVLDSYVVAHLRAARSFLPLLHGTGGTYLMFQGPLAFGPQPEYGTDLISVATAAQHMLFRALAGQHEPTGVRVVELVSYTLIRDRQTAPDSAVSGEQLADYAARLLGGEGDGLNGETLHLRTPDQLNAFSADGQPS